MTRLRDHERRSHAEDLPRFLQDHLEATRIGGTRELARPVGRRDTGELDDPALDLRDGLLSDDEHVAALEPTRTSRGVGENGREIVTILELRDPPEGNDAQLLRQPRPVTRIPA